MERYSKINWRGIGLPGFRGLFVHHVWFVTSLSVILPEVVGILEDELDGSVPSEASDAEVEPVLGGSVQVHIRVALQLDCQRGRGDHAGCSYVAGWETAVDHEPVAESDVAAIRVPLGLFLFAVRSLSHPEQLINNARSLLMNLQPLTPQNLLKITLIPLLRPSTPQYYPTPPSPCTSLDWMIILFKLICRRVPKRRSESYK